MGSPGMSQYRGAVILVFPEPPHGIWSAVPGWSMRLRDAETSKPIPTVTQFTLHADAQDILWADLTMFMDGEGNPILNGDTEVPLFANPDGTTEPKVGNFLFLVVGVEVAPLEHVVSFKQPELPFEGS